MLKEVEKYRAMKEELRRKHAPAAGSLINEETKKRADQALPPAGPPIVHQKARHQPVRFAITCTWVRCACFASGRDNDTTVRL